MRERDGAIEELCPGCHASPTGGPIRREDAASTPSTNNYNVVARRSEQAAGLRQRKPLVCAPDTHLIRFHSEPVSTTQK
ncbi:hypothetical protein EVAR_57780_1 [Eumeta japonica]|uniref:Uncharacterized protein n=1 Tax=Eumeta variegata TaxID=151549 RepID=A0A4C1Y852_EUMVA|nr:hypothetical protein EVAR_57780_1 [Eumeta japonica]